VAKDNRSH